jgi:DNA polymerase bacteriophage-type
MRDFCSGAYTQGLCRDLLANAMLKLEAAGYPIVLSVHDEIVAEVPEGTGDIAEFRRIMCDLPGWATGLPLKAEGWRDRRYRK